MIGKYHRNSSRQGNGDNVVYMALEKTTVVTKKGDNVGQRCLHGVGNNNHNNSRQRNGDNVGQRCLHGVGNNR